MCTYLLTTNVYLHLGSYLHAYFRLVFAHCQQDHPPQCTFINIHTTVCKFTYNMYVPTSRLISTCIFWPRRGSLSARPSTSKYIHKYTYMHMTHASLHTRYTVVHLGLYLHAYVCLVLPHYQPNPISASKYIYRYAYVRTQIYMQHILTYILAHIYVHTLASSTLIVRPSFSMHANVYILTCALYVSTSLYLHLCIYIFVSTSLAKSA